MGKRNPVLLTAPVDSVAGFVAAISRAVFGVERTAPTNLDGLADVLREARVTHVVASDWQLDPEETRRVQRVLLDNGVVLYR
ncbi:hypothetical protein M5J20_01255 [Corynebacterium sp. TA-R-1]|uniref:Uncharacterized protein n=1 Tax=Corynebacterium stercoris TaxID=2943490 RepID=A0ABT1FYI6_9CORY|nr:hypothetical protein [Corynebacterium stercoris]MCP1386828.1 hypothetical protein [Corynebacterium stercoris]